MADINYYIWRSLKHAGKQTTILRNFVVVANDYNVIYLRAYKHDLPVTFRIELSALGRAWEVTAGEGELEKIAEWLVGAVEYLLAGACLPKVPDEEFNDGINVWTKTAYKMWENWDDSL